MKKIFKYIPVIGLFMWACNPTDDVYDELDSQKVPYNEAVEYKLTSDDYSAISKAALKIAETEDDSTLARSIASDMAFNQKYLAPDFVEPILITHFPALKYNSTALVTYNVFEKPDYILAYEQADKYELTADDYQSVSEEVASNGYFFPSQSPESNIPTILSNNFPNAATDDYMLTTYNYSSTDPVSGPKPVTLFSDDFEDGTLSKWNAVSVIGSQVWGIDATHGVDGTQCAKVSGYVSADAASYDNEDWLITSAIGLSGITDATFSFYTAMNYTGLDLVVKYSSNYSGSGDPTGSTWTEFSGYALSASAWEWTESGTIDLSSISASTIYIAFVFTSTVEGSKTWELDNVLVTGKTTARKSATDEEYLTYNSFYQYNGTKWSPVTSIIAINPFEYDEMGSPGKYNNFSSTDKPENYIPYFLTINIDYPQEGDIQPVAYNYYNGEATLLTANEYIFTSGNWQPNGPIVEKSGQFVYTVNGWVFDPTIKFTPSASDYQLLVDYVYTTFTPDYGSSYKNDEFYYGASAHYLNFDLRLSNKVTYNIPGFEGLTTEEGIALTWERVEEGLTILLGLKYPEAVTEVSGLTVYYWLTFKTYEDDLSKKTYTGIFKLTSEGVFVRDTEYEDQMVTEEKLIEADVNWNR